MKTLEDYKIKYRQLEAQANATDSIKERAKLDREIYELLSSLEKSIKNNLVVIPNFKIPTIKIDYHTSFQPNLDNDDMYQYGEDYVTGERSEFNLKEQLKQTVYDNIEDWLDFDNFEVVIE